MKNRLTALAAAVIAALGLGLAATAANAATPGCAATTYCGSQQLTPVDRNPLMLAVTNAPGIGTPLTVKGASAANPQEDFLFTNPPNPVDNSKVFKYAPNGLAFTGKGFKGGLCVTASSGVVRAAIVLEPCTNATDQQWIAKQDANGAYYWQLRGSSYVLTDPNGGPVYTRLQLRNYWDGQNQLWTYEPQAG